MKNFLIEFFRPLDTLIFNYLVKIGVVKCIDPATAVAVGSSLLGGIFGSRSAKKAAKQRAAAIRSAYGQFRDPSEIFTQQYGDEGLYGDTAMSAILGRERELIPQFQELAEMRARGVRDIQEESKLRQLGLLGQYGEDIRSTLEDPRMAQLAGLDLAEAERLTQEAAGPLGAEAARSAEQAALSVGQATGRLGDASTIARAAQSREGAQRLRRQEAAGARQFALQSASQAAVDPFKFMFGAPSVEERQFLAAGLGPQVTDPGQAYNIGSAEDLRKAQALLGQGLAKAQGTAASGQILGSMFGSIGSTLGGMNFGQPSSMVSSPVTFGGQLPSTAGVNPSSFGNFGLPTFGG
jgi:hypothetical protein